MGTAALRLSAGRSPDLEEATDDRWLGVTAQNSNLNPLPDAASARYSQSLNMSTIHPQYGWKSINTAGKLHPAQRRQRNISSICTKSCHWPVHGVHSIENACTYRRVFFVDWKNRRSTTGSFFDSFLSFSGWCGVRGSSRVTT